MPRDNNRQDPFQHLTNVEPVEDLITGVVPATLQHPPAAGGRKTPIRPSEKRRRARKMTVTFSDERLPRRIKALTKQWGMIGPDGRRPNFSAVVEYLLLSQLEAAERGEIDPPPAKQNTSPNRLVEGEQWF